MKKHIFLILMMIIGLSSCSLDDNDSVPNTEFMPIESVEVPEFFIQGETYEILMSYTKPNDCYVFNNIIFDISGHERTVAIVNSVYNDPSCASGPELTTVSFDLTVSGNETYVFKFYQGVENGIDQYHLVEVPVVDGRYLNNPKL